MVMKTIWVFLLIGWSGFIASGQTNGNPKEPAPGTFPPILLVSVKLPVVIDAYAAVKQRTVLQHPLLPNAAFTISANPKTAAEAAAEFERSFAEHGIAAVPDGQHFVMLVPTALTNNVTPNSDKIATNGAAIPSASVIFRTVPLSLVLPVYADFANRKIINQAEAPPTVVFTLIQQTALSREEICYAMETLFAWNNVRLHTNDDNTLKIERVR